MKDDEKLRRLNLRRKHSVTFIFEAPILWLFLVYAMTFFGCSIAIDTLDMVTGSNASTATRYLLPSAIGLPMGIGLVRWARRNRQS
jgi:hypothetical protein